MMAEYIDIDKAVLVADIRGREVKTTVRHILGLNKGIYDTDDVQPVRHGRWQITDAYPHNVYCSECHAKCAQTHWAVWEDGSLPRAFCPNCGAKMMELEDDEDGI